MRPIEVGLVIAALIAAVIATACGLTVSRAARRLALPTSCPDGRPVVVIQSLGCENGYCGYTCEPTRWEKPCVP